MKEVDKRLRTINHFYIKRELSLQISEALLLILSFFTCITFIFLAYSGTIAYIPSGLSIHFPYTYTSITQNFHCKSVDIILTFCAT